MVNKKSAQKTLAFVNLYTPNFKKITTFYKEVLRIPALKQNKGNWLGFSTGQTTFAIEPQTNRKDHGTKYNKNNPVLLQFCLPSVKELTKATELLEKNNAYILARLVRKTYGTITTFLDPDNNVVELLVKRK